MKRFKEKTVIITGADSDAGRAIALRFAQEGANCIIVGGNAELLSCIYDDLPQDHTWINTGNHLTVTSDIHDESQTARLVAHVLDKYDHIDVMVNIDTIIGIHHSVIPELKKTQGNIVHVSTLTDFSADWQLTAYKAEQEHLANMTKSLALKNITNNIRINAVTAGRLATDAHASSFAAHCPLGRAASPSDVTAAVMFLASDDAAIITGQHLPIDGGIGTFID